VENRAFIKKQQDAHAVHAESSLDMSFPIQNPR